MIDQPATGSPSRSFRPADRPAIPRAANAPVASDMLILAFACLAGCTNAVLLLGARRLDPSDVSWMANDPAQVQVAWEFLRHAAGWRWPLTWLDGLGYPLGVSASYLDVNPLVALPLSLVSRWLPTDFQYLGPFALACHVLQAYFGFKLVARFRDDAILAAIGSLMFLMAPILTWRLFGHYALSSQWVIVAGLYFYFSPKLHTDLARYLAPFVALCFLAGGITPYIALFAVAISGAAILRALLEKRSSVLAACRGGAVVAGVTLLSLLVFGFISTGSTTQFSGGGYTEFSMNLLSPIDPGGFPSLVLPTLPTFESQYEGYNYLGLGVITLSVIVVARRPRILSRMADPSILPLAIMGLLLTILALSTKVTVGQQVVAVIPAPEAVVRALASFRASGRLFWPVHYLVILFAVAGACAAFPRPWTARALLLGALGLQILDTVPLRAAVSARGAASHADPLASGEWERLPRAHRHLVVLPAWQCGPTRTPGGADAWYWFARLAARTGMTVNSFYGTRPSPASVQTYCSTMPRTLFGEGPADDTAVVVDDAGMLRIALRPGNRHFCRAVDAFNLCTFDPQAAARARPAFVSMVPSYRLGTAIRAEDPAREAVLEGWQPGSAPSLWSMDRSARVYLRPAFSNADALHLRADFGMVLVSPVHPSQRAVVSVNGVTLGTWEFRAGDPSMIRSIEIPAGTFENGELAVLGFEFPDAAQPNRIGINEDGSTLAWAFRTFEIVSGR